MSPYVNGRAKKTLGDYETTDNLIPTEVLERVRHIVITTTFLNKIDSFYSSSVQVGENARSLDIEKAEELQKKQISNNLLFSKLDSSSTFYGIPSSGAGRLDRADALAYMKRLRITAKTHTDHLVLSIQLSALRLLHDIRIKPLEKQLVLFNLIRSVYQLVKNSEEETAGTSSSTSSGHSQKKKKKGAPSHTVYSRQHKQQQPHYEQPPSGEMGFDF